MTNRIFSGLAALLLAVLGACGGGSTPGAGVPPTVTAPSITSQPQAQTVTVGSSATFSVVAVGTAPLQYQWQKDGANISGANSANYTTPATVAADSGAGFQVQIMNGSGTVTSNQAKLTVNPVPPASGASTDISTYKYDVSRSGLNASESTLTLSNVNSSNFGLLRTLAVDGKVDAQPLYLAHLSVAGAAHNVVFAATEHGSVWAFDADTGSKLWQVSVLKTGESPATR